jgi:hypothetical protein
MAAMLERDVAGLAAFRREADPDQLGGDAVAAICLVSSATSPCGVPPQSSGRAPLPS